MVALACTLRCISAAMSFNCSQRKTAGSTCSSKASVSWNAGSKTSARHEFDGPFHALEFAADGAGKGAQHRGLADADIAFEQHMAAREQRHIDQADDLRLADHRLGHLALHTPGAALPVLE